MTLNKKDRILKAMRTILQEYKNEMHTTSTTDCKLCKLFLNKGKSRYARSCNLCPMDAFIHHKDCCGYPCMNRRCEPVDCSRSFEDDRWHAVIEFYENAIDQINGKTNDELKGELAFEFLIEIDERVANHYNLPK